MCEGDSVRSGVYIATKGEQRAYKDMVLVQGLRCTQPVHLGLGFLTFIIIVVGHLSGVVHGKSPITMDSTIYRVKYCKHSLYLSVVARLWLLGHLSV